MFKVGDRVRFVPYMWKERGPWVLRRGTVIQVLPRSIEVLWDGEKYSFPYLSEHLCHSDGLERFCSKLKS